MIIAPNVNTWTDKRSNSWLEFDNRKNAYNESLVGVRSSLHYFVGGNDENGGKFNAIILRRKFFHIVYVFENKIFVRINSIELTFLLC